MANFLHRSKLAVNLILGGELCVYDDGEHIFLSEGASFDVQHNGLQTSTDTCDWRPEFSDGFQFDMVSVLEPLDSMEP